MPWRPPPHDPARALREHLPPEAWRAALGEICARHDLDASALASFASGSDVVWAAGDAVVKLTAPLWRDEIAAEARWLRAVAGRLPVATPRVLATGELAGWPYVVTTLVPGTPLAAAWEALDHDERLRLAADLGRLARALHDVPVDPQLAREQEPWPAFWSACRADVAARHLRRGAPAALAAEIELFLMRAGELAHEPLVLLHTELLGEHVLVAPRAGGAEPCALLDFADARLGPPWYDFAAPVEFVFRGERGLLRAFLLAYGLAPDALDAALPERLLAAALCHRFGSLPRLLAAALPARPSRPSDLARALFDVGEEGGRPRDA